jgi:selenide,water dikinase
MGARAVTALNVVGFPDKDLELEVLHSILAGGAAKVMEAGAVISGGHSVRDSEIKYGLSVTGVVSPDQLLTNERAQPGDAIVLTKALGTGFVTTAAKARKCPQEILDAAIASMTMLNSFGNNPACTTHAHAATDVTGFGLAGHAAEMARASGVTVRLRISQLPDLPGAVELWREGHNTRASKSNRDFVASEIQQEPGVDADRLELAFDAQTSGGLLIAVPKERADELVQSARQSGATATAVIGEVIEQQAGVTLVLQP